MIRILNKTIMILNIKDIDFEFKQVFLNKIENLIIILELYKSNPLTLIQDLKYMMNIASIYQAIKRII